MPSSLQAQITRRAISPRFAIRIFLNMKGCARSCCGQSPGAALGAPPNPAHQVHPELRLSTQPDDEQFLSVFNGLSVGRYFLDYLAPDIRLNLVHQLHSLDDAQQLSDFNLISQFDKGW